MSDQLSTAPLESDQPYLPNPAAARILSQAVQFAFIPDPLPDLPPEWMQALAAVTRMRDFSRHSRWHTFVAAVSAFNYAMVEEVAAAMQNSVDRLEKDRVLYATKDALHDPPRLEWAVEGLFAQPSLNLLVGDPGSKKTFLAIDLAVSVAMGKPWLGHAVNPCPVLFVDEETGMHQLWNRLNASLHAHGADISTPFEFISLGGYDFRDNADAEQLIHRARGRGSGFIVIDALANLMHSGENNLGSVQPVLFNLRRMAESCKAAVIVIHHNNRHGVFRGSSSISAGVDLMLSIRSAPADSLIELSAFKARFKAPQPFCARATFETAPDGQERFHLEPTDEKPTSLTPLPAPVAPRKGLTLCILEFLEQNRSATREQLTTHLSAHTEGSIRFALHELLSSGQIKRADSGSKGTKAVYELSS
ncbi:MAG: AAA family ATPase [Bacteroidota bacterium]